MMELRVAVVDLHVLQMIDVVQMIQIVVQLQTMLDVVVLVEMVADFLVHDFVTLRMESSCQKRVHVNLDHLPYSPSSCAVRQRNTNRSDKRNCFNDSLMSSRFAKSLKYFFKTYIDASIPIV